MISVLFENHHLYYLPNFLPIIKELKQRGGYIIFASIPEYMNNQEKNIFYGVCEKLGIECIRENDEESRLNKIKNHGFDVIMVGNVGELKNLVVKKTVVVMVYHGIGLKQTYYKDTDPRIDLRAVESEPRMEELKFQGHKNLILTGFTKCDPLIDPFDSTEKFCTDLGLSSGRKIVVFAPSFYPSSQEQLLGSLENLSLEFNIIVKLHHFSWYQKRYIYQSEAMTVLAERNKNIYLVPPETYNIIPFYQIADVLVTDVSSTMFEYLPMDRPIIMAECFTLRLKDKIFKKRFLRKIDLERMEAVDFTYKLNDPDDLLSLVYHVLDYPEEMKTQRLNAQVEYLYKVDGLASHRLVESLEEKLAQDRP